MLNMYPAIVNSPLTSLVRDIDDSQTTIEVTDASKLPDGPNIAVIGRGENAETILYEAKSGNILTGVLRGFQGTARSWPYATEVARYFTAYDYDALRQNLAEHLNDYVQFKSEMTQPDTLTTPKQISPIISLPNAVDGQTSVGVEGRTYANLLGDGTAEKIIDHASATQKNDLTFAVDGHRYLVITEGYISSESTSGLNLRWQDISGINPTNERDKWVLIGYIGTYLSSATNNYYGFYSSSIGTNKIKNQMCIDLTALGETETDINKLLQKYPYISGTKSTTNTRIKSVGKNLFDKNKVKLNAYISLSNGYTVTYDGLAASDYIVISNNEKYIFKNTTYTTVAGLAFYDSNKQFISSLSQIPRLEFSIPEGAKYLRASFSSFQNMDTGMLYKSSLDSPYEPYKESISYITLPEGVDGLHSLPNSVKDEVPPDGDLIKRAKEYVLQESDVIEISTLYDNVDYAKINKPLNFKYADKNYNTDNNILGSIILGNLPMSISTDYTNTNQINKVNLQFSIASFYVGFAKGTTLEQAQQALAGTKLIYQLAEPQIYDLAVTPVTCFKDGTIYIESADDAEEYVVPETQFTYPVNTAGVIQSNVEGINELGNTMNLKANKGVHIIDATLQNGWVNTYTNNALRYFKDGFGIVHLLGEVKDGTVTSGTSITTLPIGYRPRFSVPCSAIKANDSSLASFQVNSTGELIIGDGHTTGTFRVSVSYKAI